MNPSPDIEQLKKDAESFLKQNSVGSHRLMAQGNLPVSGYAMLVKVDSKIYEIHLAPSQGNYTVHSYFVGYKPISTQGDDAAFVDIPKKAAELDFLFTAELAGCSLIVTDYNSSHYRVYHDSRPMSSAFYDRVVMAADLTDYIGGLEVDPNQLLLTVCLQYKQGKWKLYAQLLKENDKHQRIIRPTGSDILPSVWTRSPGEYVKPAIRDLRARIETYMRNLLDTLNGDLKYWGKQPVAIPTVVDGRFVDFPSTSSPPLTNPAVARTEAWRQALREAKNRLGDKGKAYEDLVRSGTERSRSIDIAYLWLLKKGK
ncbi:hypothetical protein BDV24DRAFT_1444 [Aspergillus arachidicola]|uniref:Uncharacterized protein n=1 Tax=Aspergillus arachidicola TaxID=656916 RepID=A0A5N6YQP8_9EURO|nr:hypothetical protein BDV24DRAFT_1444 [Aspergillus arachidicola]